MNQRFVTQLNESPYNAVRGFSRKGEGYRHDASRRIVTENEATSNLHTPGNYNNKYSNRFGTRKGTINQSVQEGDDLQLLIGIQSNKDHARVSNFNNIHININHNEFIHNKKYFPTLKKRMANLSNPQKLQKLATQPEEPLSRTPQQQKKSSSQQRQQHQSTSLHENTKDLLTKKRDNEQRSASTHVSQPPKVLKPNESFEGKNQLVDTETKSYQNMIIAQIRDRKDLIQFTNNKIILDNKRMKLTNSYKTKTLSYQPKKGNFMIDSKQLPEASIEQPENQRSAYIPQTTTNASKLAATPQQKHHQSFSQSNNQINKIVQNFSQQSHHKQLSFHSHQTPQSTSNNKQNSTKALNTSQITGAKIYHSQQQPQTQPQPSQQSTTKPLTQQQEQQQRKPLDVQIDILNQQSVIQPTKKVHPKVLWDMSDEEWQIFGDRFPIQFDKKKLLGRQEEQFFQRYLFRGGFSLVWLGEHRKTKERFAIKQILSNNTHQSHMKEIWFGTFFFENGNPKQEFDIFPGSKNLVRFLAYDAKPQDTWIFYEICGESLGNHLYDLKGENHGQERIYRIYHRSLYNTLRKENVQLKKLLKHLAEVLDLLQTQRIVHSDLKTENILIKTEKLPNGQHNITQIKLIDYGSSFPFDDLKQFSMATPEYMCPEILNYILFENSLNYHQSLLKYLQKYDKPWTIDIWSLGCVILEIISGIPLWMSLKTIVNKKGKDVIEYGLFAVKGRVFEKIIERQIEVITNLDLYLENQCFSGIQIDNDIKYLLKRMLALNPDKRISPKEIIAYLDPQPQSNKILFTQ